MEKSFRRRYRKMLDWIEGEDIRERLRRFDELLGIASKEHMEALAAAEILWRDLQFRMKYEAEQRRERAEMEERNKSGRRGGGNGL